MKELTTSEVLDLAADAIQMAGWTKGSAGMRPEGPYCLMGSLGSVLGTPLQEDEPEFFDYTPIWQHPAARAIAEYIGPQPYEGHGAITMWNDLRTDVDQQRIIETLRGAAAVERVKEAVAFRGYETEDQPLPLDAA